jgi:hypothetical protein
MAINGFQITPEFIQQLQAYIGNQGGAPQQSRTLMPYEVPSQGAQYNSFFDNSAVRLANPWLSGNPLVQPPTPPPSNYVGQAVNTPNTVNTGTNTTASTNTNITQSNEPEETLGSANWTGALIGAGAGIVNELLGGEDEMVKQKQAWLDEMENRNRANNETIRATNSESNRRGAMLGLNQAKAGAMAQAANIGAGQALGSGLGGDVSSQQIAGVKAAAPVMATAGQFGQAEAGLMGQKANEDAQRNQALIQNQQAGTDIENQRLYLNKQKGSNWLNAIAGGTGIWKNIVDSMPKSTGTHDKEDGK